MIVTIDRLLDNDELALIRERLAQCTFASGADSAGGDARAVKNNEEAVRDRRLGEIDNLLMGKLVRHPTYQGAVIPKQVAVPYYARYTQGHSYGAHIDDPLMPGRTVYRSDVAITVFISDADDYTGGELVIRTGYGEHRYKSSAGSAILYSAASTHSVSEVTAGERLVAVTWAQSMVRDPSRRRLLYELFLTRESLRESQPDSAEYKRVAEIYANLVRMWAET